MHCNTIHSKICTIRNAITLLAHTSVTPNEKFYNRPVLSNPGPHGPTAGRMARGGTLCGPPMPMKILGNVAQFYAHFS